MDAEILQHDHVEHFGTLFYEVYYVLNDREVEGISYQRAQPWIEKSAGEGGTLSSGPFCSGVRELSRVQDATVPARSVYPNLTIDRWGLTLNFLPSPSIANTG